MQKADADQQTEITVIQAIGVPKVFDTTTILCYYNIQLCCYLNPTSNVAY